MVGARRDECGERRTASVYRDMVEQGLLVGMQEVVAPFDECPKRGTPRIRGRPLVEKIEAAPDEGDELREPEHVDPRSGELYGER